MPDRKARSRSSSNATPAQPTVPPERQGLSKPAEFRISEVEHGLSYPEFNANDWFAQDLTTDSSSLEGTDVVDADAAVASIERKRQTLRVVQSNIALNTDLVKTATAQEKFVGNVIDYATARVGNHAKFINYQTAGINVNIAQTKYQQANERLNQEAIALNGMAQLTPLIREEWEEKKALKQSRIAALKQSAMAASANLDADLKQLSTAAS